ncbi:MAG: cytochrome c family protein [Alphaproteobacteria bacterium]|nr:cytochrome c family protein [Alphaproteobacteria bacterium]
MAALLAALPAKGASAADVEAGKNAFARCRVCHTLAAGAGSTVGPNLHGVYGRKAGTAEGFRYSEAMKASGIVWDDDTLAHFLRDPKGTVPGNRMAFPGISDETELQNLLAFLKQAAQ